MNQLKVLRTCFKWPEFAYQVGDAVYYSIKLFPYLGDIILCWSCENYVERKWESEGWEWMNWGDFNISSFLRIWVNFKISK